MDSLCFPLLFFRPRSASHGRSRGQIVEQRSISTRRFESCSQHANTLHNDSVWSHTAAPFSFRWKKQGHTGALFSYLLDGHYIESETKNNIQLRQLIILCFFWWGHQSAKYVFIHLFLIGLSCPNNGRILRLTNTRQVNCRYFTRSGTTSCRIILTSFWKEKRRFLVARRISQRGISRQSQFDDQFFLPFFIVN